MQLFHLSLFFGLFSQLWCVSSDPAQSSISYEYQASSHHANSDDYSETKSRNSNERWWFIQKTSQSQQDDQLVQEDDGWTNEQQPRPSRQVSIRDIQPVASSELRSQATGSENSLINLADVPKIKSAPTVKENYLKKYIEENSIVETDGISSEEESYEYHSNVHSSGDFFFEEEQTSLGPGPSSVENIRHDVKDFSQESTKSTSIIETILNSNDITISTTKEIDSNKLFKDSLNKLSIQVYDSENSFERKEILIKEEATQDLTIVGKTLSEPETSDFKPIINNEMESNPRLENSQLQTDIEDVKELPVTENETKIENENLSHTSETVFKSKNVDETPTDEQLSVTQQILPTVLQESKTGITQSKISSTNDIVPGDDFENLIPQQQQQSVSSEFESKSISPDVDANKQRNFYELNATSQHSNQNKNHIFPKDISLSESIFTNNKGFTVPVAETITNTDIEADSLIVQKDVAALKSSLLNSQVNIHGEPVKTVDKDSQEKLRVVKKEVAEPTSSVIKNQIIVPKSEKTIDYANEAGSLIMSQNVAESASSVADNIQLTVAESAKVIDDVNHPKRRIVSEVSSSSSSFSSKSEITSAQDASGKEGDTVKPSRKSIISNDAIAASSSSIVSSSQVIETGQKSSSPEIITSKDMSASSSYFASNSQIIISEQDADGKKEPTKNIIKSKADVALSASSSVSKTESLISEHDGKTENNQQTVPDEHIISKDTPVSSSSSISSTIQNIVPENVANIAIDEPVKPSEISITSRNTAESASSISFKSNIPDNAKIKTDEKHLGPSNGHSMLKETSASSLSESILESKSNLQGKKHIGIASAGKNNEHHAGSNAHIHTSHNSDTENSKIEPGYDTILEYLYAHSNSSFIMALKNSNPKRNNKTG